MRHLVVQNPFAGRRRDQNAAALEDGLRARNLDYTLFPTERRGHAVEIVAEHGASHDAVIVVGGDGTLHEVIQTLDLARHRLGVIPWGTGNDFAWTHGWPPDLDACLDRIAAKRERRIDLGSWEAIVNGEPRHGRFHNSVGLGFEATVNAESHRITRLQGPAVYVIALVRSLSRYRNYRVKFEWEDRTTEETVSLLSVSNGPRVGGAFYIAPDADPADGLLDIVRAGEMSLVRALLFLPGLFTGKHVRSSHVRIDRTSRLRIVSPEGIPAYVDGEFVDHRVMEMQVSVEAGALGTF